MTLQGKSSAPPAFVSLTLVHLAMAFLLGIRMLYLYLGTSAFQFLILGGLALTFGAVQLTGWRRCRSASGLQRITWAIILTLVVCILVIPIFVGNPLPACLLFVAVIPLNVTATGQLKQLPTVLFFVMVMSAAAISIDLILSDASWRLVVDVERLWGFSVAGLSVYLGCLGRIWYRERHKPGRTNVWRVNVATQYVLVFTGISAMVVFLVTGVMIHQVRKAQVDQVGKTFQTIAENIAKLVGSHLEQQTQKLQLLTEQVPIFREALLHANEQYESRDSARRLLAEKSRFWEGAARDETFVMNYLNNPILEVLSRFRGFNSFHNDLVLVDGYGGLVASLGQIPEHFYFYDQRWWKIVWNNGLGNIFIGDLMLDKRTGIPMLRIAVDIVDHTTNEVIGMLSSTYLLTTILEDIKRFQTDAVGQISMTDIEGRVIACTVEGHTDQHGLSKSGEFIEPLSGTRPGWKLGLDHLGQDALIGFSSLSTAYNVLSDPLHRLGWHVVVSGSRTKALAEVTQSTKLAVLVGLLAMALGVFGAIGAARVITRPIEELTSTAADMINGDLDNRAKPAGPEELVTLSDGFNRLTDRLHQVIRNLRYKTSQLAKAKQEAETATKLKGEFLANMSHEIRTPLNAILGFADILESSLNDENKKRHAQTIKTSGADLLHLINDILDLSKIESGRMELHIAPVDLRALLDELQKIFFISAGEKMIRLEMEAVPELPDHLMLDRVRLRQVLFNLIGNAIKFTDQGHVRCIAGGLPSRRDNHWNLLIEIHDTGIGVEPGAYKEIFRNFEQHHAGTLPTKEGTGLGLAISKNLVEMMGGQIDVHGEPGKGSIFSIHIPRIKTAVDGFDPHADERTAAEPRDVRFGPASLLVADDLEVNRRLIVETLKPFPIEIQHAENGKAAVAMASKVRFDLILMDIRMPDMDGYRTLDEIRHRLKADAPPVIATTAGGMKEEIAKIEKAGFDDHLIRPFSQEALVQLLLRYLPGAYAAESSISTESGSPMTEADIESGLPWRCSSGAKEYICVTLKQRWEQVVGKQSIPEIVDFANDVRKAGKRHRIEMLERYGRELAEYAEGFDIDNLEKLLRLFDIILSPRDKGGGEDVRHEVP